MKRFFFLPSLTSYFLVLLLLYGFWKLPLLFLIPLILINTLVLFVSRRSLIPYRDTLKNDGEIYLSPVHGIVESVRHQVSVLDQTMPCHEIRISMSFWDEKGLYLPTAGEVAYLKASQGKKINRYAPNEVFYGSIDQLAHTDFILMSKNQTRTQMRFVDARGGKRPTIWLKSGDRGRAAACFGYYPFGGTLLIYLPATSDILVFEKERVTPGQTVIAALKDQPKV